MTLRFRNRLNLVLSAVAFIILLSNTLLLLYSIWNGTFMANDYLGINNEGRILTKYIPLCGIISLLFKDLYVCVITIVIYRNTIKRRGVRVVGRLKQNRWKDNDGKNQSKIIVVAEHCEYKPKANAEEGTKAEGSKEIRKEYSIEKAKESLDSAYAKADGYSVPEEETADETKVITEGQEKEEAVF